MVASCHDMAFNTIDENIERNPDVTFVPAHPGAHGAVLRRIERKRE